MYGFLLIGYNQAAIEMVSSKKLEQELDRKGINYKKNIINNNKVFDTIINYQLFKESDNKANLDSSLPILVGGDIYGHLRANNDNILNYYEAMNLVHNSRFCEEYVAFEGNACIGLVTDEKLIFQNDLEGCRKLYYFQNKDIFCISTYLPLILTVINEKWTLRKNAVLSYICSRESKWPLTFIENILVLPPLSRAELTKIGLKITSHTFSDFYNLEKISKENLRKQLYEKYELIIKRKSSENTAVTLSGGYDSNCLTKLFTNVYGKDFTAVSVGYKAKHERGTNINDETGYAKKIANKLGIPFKRYFFDKEDFFSELTHFIDAIDQPGHDPSSNFIMDRNLRADGFNLIVSGNGGDQNFASKRNLTYAWYMHKTSQQLRVNFPQFFGRYLKYRGPFNYFKPLSFEENQLNQSFHNLYERAQLFGSPICKNINPERLKEIDHERDLSVNYFNNIYIKSKTIYDIFYSLALIEDPEVYHVLSMAERNNIEILLPFVNTKAALTLINGSNFHKVNTREFETSIFGGIDEELLAKSKSGFSIPYAEWMPFVADNVFEFYNDIEYFSNDDFDIQSFQFNYKNNATFRNSNLANIVIWKLLVVMEYIKTHNINIY